MYIHFTQFSWRFYLPLFECLWRAIKQFLLSSGRGLCGSLFAALLWPEVLSTIIKWAFIDFVRSERRARKARKAKDVPRAITWLIDSLCRPGDISAALEGLLIQFWISQCDSNRALGRNVIYSLEEELKTHSKSLWMPSTASNRVFHPWAMSCECLRFHAHSPTRTRNTFISHAKVRTIADVFR